jgi:hypothetical protein
VSTEPEELTPELRRCLRLLAAAYRERDEDRARVLIEASGEALVADARARWGEKLEAAKTLNAEAERVLNQAEATSDRAERRALMQLFETYLAAAREGLF